MVEVLVGWDADVNTKNQDGETSLHLALKKEKRVKVSNPFRPYFKKYILPTLSNRNA